MSLKRTYAYLDITLKPFYITFNTRSIYRCKPINRYLTASYGSPTGLAVISSTLGGPANRTEYINFMFWIEFESNILKCYTRHSKESFETI